MNTLLKFVLSDIIIVAVCFMASPYFYTLSPLYKATNKAVAIVYPTKDNSVSGVVTFTKVADGVQVVADFKGLTPGKHGFHLHEFGNCACDTATCAGDHFNPTAQPHGGPESKQRHVGDFGNVVANEQGEAHLELIDKQLQLNGRHSIVGRSVIIHAQEDDLVSQPSGNSGARIGCGNIGIAK